MSLQAPKRGAMPSPRSTLAAATPFTTRALIGAPPNFIVIPQKLSFWGNDVHGDCVTAEEAFAKACNNPEIFIPEADAIAWATRHGVLEGAYLTQVMQWMQNDGFAEGPVTYDDGSYVSVNWTDAGITQSAISEGPVKLGIAAGQLEVAWRSTNGRSGWFARGFNADANEDHCVALCGYGTISWLAQQLNVQVPAGVDGTRPGYALFTWNSIGVIDAPSMVAITHEAWLRRPTTITRGSDFTGKVTLQETSPKSPRLASFGGRLYLGWKGNGNDWLNVMSSADNGASFGNKFTSHETSPEAPSLCVHNQGLYIAWMGSGNHKLNVAHVMTNGSAIVGFSGKVTLGDASPLTPAICSFNGRLYMAWKGDGNNLLNVMYSSDNGATFGNKYTSHETSPQAPALTVHNGALYIAWKGDGNDHLNVAQVAVAGNAVTGFNNKVTLPDTSPFTPALASANGRLNIGWRGDGNANLNVEWSANATNFGNKVTSLETSSQAPGLAGHNGGVFITWKGNGNDLLNVARLAS